MRIRVFPIATCVLLSLAVSALAHGPQIQITNDNNKIVTRELALDGPYSTSLTSTKSVYVMPIEAFDGVWYSHPNGALDPITSLPAFPSGPGLAYGYDFADGGPQAFVADSIFSIGFTAGLKSWNGTSYTDAGSAELKAFRGSNAEIATPPENFAISSDSGPFDSLSLAAVAADYGTSGAEVHSSIRFALLGDGSLPVSASEDGVYLASLQISSTQAGLAPSDPYHFVLHKNSSMAVVDAAVNSLGVAPELVQYVPEPTSLGTLALAGLCLGLIGRRTRRN